MLNDYVIIEMRHMLCACKFICSCAYAISMPYVYVVISMFPCMYTYFLHQIHITSFHLSIIFNDIFRFVKIRRHHNTLGRLLPISTSLALITRHLRHIHNLIWIGGML